MTTALLRIRGAIVGKVRRAFSLGLRMSATRIRERFEHIFGFRPNVRRLAYWFDRYSRTLYEAPYQERRETGPINLSVKLERQRLGGHFEPPSIKLINHAVVTLIREDECRILEVGAGTGLFAWIASENQRRSIVASELDAPARTWASEHRYRSNVEYCAKQLSDFADHSFDLVVAIEVIEHVFDFGQFLRELSRIANRAIITTPNRQRSPFTSVDRTPTYSEHVREWNAGEFLWVLRVFYGDVRLLTIPNMSRQADSLMKNDTYRPRLINCSDLSCEESLIAVCTNRPPEIPVRFTCD